MTFENKKLLLIDDDVVFTEVLSRALKRHGFDVHVAHSVVDAVLEAKNTLFEYAVVDLRIAQDSGLTMVKELVLINPQINIVVLTGYASIATAVEAIKLGAKQYLTKPADVEEIIEGFGKVEGDELVEPALNPMSVKRLEWEHLQKVLQEHDGNISAAARAMDIQLL